jgi:urease accessory protein
MRERDTLELRLQCDRLGQTRVAHQYTTYPLRVSDIFRLDEVESDCAYLYLINTSPGLLAQDSLSLALNLEADTSMYFTDQAATKVHPMPKTETKATANWKITIGAGASLELVPEPVILFAEAAFEQTTQISLHPQAALFCSEILIPGRLARGEYYDFRYYHNCLEIYSHHGELWFRDAIRLVGKDNPFKQHNLFIAEPILANLIMIQPQTDLAKLKRKIANLTAADCQELIVASSLLPKNRGLLIRIMAFKTWRIKKYINYVLNCVRYLSDRPCLPYIPK